MTNIDEQIKKDVDDDVNQEQEDIQKDTDKVKEESTTLTIDKKEETEKEPPIEENDQEKNHLSNTIEIPIERDVWTRFKKEYLETRYTEDQLTLDLQVSKTNSVFLEFLQCYKRNPSTTSSTSLLFNGKKPRKDVLVKLGRIVRYFHSQDKYPTIPRIHVDEIVKIVLGDVDQRTMDKYLKCIKQYSLPKKNDNGFVMSYNVSNLFSLIPDQYIFTEKWIEE